MEQVRRLANFEFCVINAQYFQAVQILHQILSDYQQTIQMQGVTENYYQRLVVSLFQLLTDQRYVMSQTHYQLLCANHSTIAMVINIAGFDHADHILMQIANSENSTTIKFNNQSDAYKGLLLYSLNSRFDYDLLKKSKIDPELIAPLLLGLLGTKCLISAQAEKNFDQLLEQDWTHLSGYSPSLANMVSMSNSWMYCSYAHTPDKHKVKATLNQMIKNWAPNQSLSVPLIQNSHTTSKILIPLEILNQNHAMFRCFKRVLEQLTEAFYTIALVPEKNIDEVARECFTETISFDPIEVYNGTDAFFQRLTGLQCDAVYYPSLGMANYTLLIANYRLAPIQLYTLGHPATTYIDTIDYVLVQQQDFATADVFSEKVLITGNEMSSTILSVFESGFDFDHANENNSEQVIHVAITSTHMKINYRFFDICRRIEQNCKSEIFFHIFPAATGHLLRYLEKEFSSLLKNLCVYETTDFETYIKNLSQCQVRLGTFPFGGANSNMDCFALGIPFIAMDGVEPHARSDVGQLNQAGLSELIAQDQQDYIAKAIRLIDDAEYRTKIRERIIRLREHPFFNGNISQQGSFCNTVKWMLENHEQIQTSEKRVWTLEDQCNQELA